jgi:hypothetical protein
LSTSEPGAAFHLVGVVRGERRRIPLREEGRRPGSVEAVRFRDLAALLRPGPAAAEPDAAEVLAHHRAVEEAMQRGDVVPAPWGVVLSQRDEAAELLRDQYVELDHALALVDGRWEFRLHLSPAALGSADADWAARFNALYAELRPLARAALPAPPADRRSFSASFLVDRVSSDAFSERVQELRDEHPDLAVEQTGPWPPYDFVRITF